MFFRIEKNPWKRIRNSRIKIQNKILWIRKGFKLVKFYNKLGIREERVRNI